MTQPTLDIKWRTLDDAVIYEMHVRGLEPVSLIALPSGYSSRKAWLGPVDEFRDLVKSLIAPSCAA